MNTTDSLTSGGLRLLASSTSAISKQLDDISNEAMRIISSPSRKPSSWPSVYFLSKSNLYEKNHEYFLEGLQRFIKVAVVAWVVLGAWVIITHPILTVSTLLAGLVVKISPDTSRTTKEWLRKGHQEVLGAIINEQSALEKTALALMAISVSLLLATTLFPSVGFGLSMGLYIRYKTNKEKI